jgi:hypothetical protein
MKRLSIFIVSIFLVSILFINYQHHHRENRIFQDDCFICCTVGANLDFSMCYIYPVLLNTLFTSIIIINKHLFSPRILPYRFFTRAPPE